MYENDYSTLGRGGLHYEEMRAASLDARLKNLRFLVTEPFYKNFWYTIIHQHAFDTCALLTLEYS